MIYGILSRSTAAIIAAWAAGLLVGCSPNWDTHYSTEHLEIETEFSDPLCQGDLERWETLVVDLESDLDAPLEPGLAISLWDEFDWPNGRWCPKNAVGCYSRSLHRIYTTFSALEHELVHAVADGLGSNEPFFDEGVAEALHSGATHFGASLPSSNLGLETLEVDRITAGHFVRWLWETHGAQPLRDLLASKGDRDAFAEIYGVSFDEAEARYLEEAPWSYPPLFVHEVPGVTITGEELWEEEVAIDCGRSDAYGRIGGLAIVRTLTIDATGSYGLWTSADGLSISRRQRAIISNEAEAIQQLEGDIPANMLQWRKGGEVHVLELAPAEYEIWITDFDRDLESAQIAIWAHPGPIPTLPEAQP